jgi:transcriptional regulator with XRE-family HTH domain
VPSPAVPNHRTVASATKSNWAGHGVRSRLAAARKSKGLSQEQVAPAVGLSLATYRRLETLEIANPPLLYLVNCALVLDVELVELVEDEWVTWSRLSAGAPAEPPNLRPRALSVNRPIWPPAAS